MGFGSSAFRVAKDNKYGEVTLEKGDIGDDEPVFVFRAQDALMAPMLAEYMKLCMLAGSPQRHLELILEARGKVIAWQKDHYHQIPRSDGY